MFRSKDAAGALVEALKGGAALEDFCSVEWFGKDTLNIFRAPASDRGLVHASMAYGFSSRKSDRPFGIAKPGQCPVRGCGVIGPKLVSANEWSLVAKCEVCGFRVRKERARALKDPFRSGPLLQMEGMLTARGGVGE